jgi:hypothetical protein
MRIRKVLVLLCSLGSFLLSAVHGIVICPVICLLISTSVYFLDISEEFIGLKIVGENMENNKLNINLSHAMNRFDYIKIATMCSILIT